MGCERPACPMQAGLLQAGEKNSRVTRKTETKNEAIEKARKIAKKQKTELVIHNKDGKISDKDSYGNDPHPCLQQAGAEG